MKQSLAWRVLTTAAVLACPVAAAQAGYGELIGYSQLQAELGDATPTGAGIEVAHVEAPDASGNYQPDPNRAGFFGKTFIAPAQTGGSSGHASAVGDNFYGNTGSIAPGISHIHVYEASYWMRTGFLNRGRSVLPQTTSARIANHSWIGQFTLDSTAGEVLRRFDYVVDQDDYLQVVGVPNPGGSGNPIWRSAYNGISVGLTAGNHPAGTVAVDSLYTADRVAPTLVAPSTGTSWAAPMVSAAAALLLETGADPALSLGSYTNRTRTIQHAESSEVVKALLMAGADRRVGVANYTLDTANNLDRRYGAGQLNIANSHRILRAGEQNSAQDAGPAAGLVQATGWDYDPRFGGLNGANDTASYRFLVDSLARINLTAALVWNLDVDISTVGGGALSFDEHLYDLDLLLYDITGGTETLLASSTSAVDNTEHIFYEGLEVGNLYELRVLPGLSQSAFAWDYALAWQTTPEPGTLLLLALGSVLACRRRRSAG